jgi:hypothetical protein
MKRVETVMKVQMGLLTAAEAARELGIARTYYYEIEEEMLRAALGAVTPEKPGPKPVKADPHVAALEEKLRTSERERELLEMKVKHLEDLQREMVRRGVGALREKKRSQGGHPRRDRTPIHGAIPAIGALEGGGAAARGRVDPGTLPGDGAPSGKPMAMEEERSGGNEAGPEGIRG